MILDYASNHGELSKDFLAQAAGDTLAYSPKQQRNFVPLLISFTVELHC